MSKDNDERWGEIGGDVSHEVRGFLHDQHLSVVGCALDQGTIVSKLLMSTLCVILDL